MDYINNGVTLPKTSLVDALLQQFNPDEISAFRGQLNGIDESASMLLSALSSTPPAEQSEQLAEAQKQIEHLQAENDDLSAQVQTLQLELSGNQVELLNWKEKFAAEQKRADESLSVAEKAVGKLKQQKK